MGPVLAALIGAAGTVATNIWNARSARENRAFQERMSSTAHQREVADLRRAGINPMVRSMSGASAPSGDRAEMQDPGRGVSSALAVQLAKSQIDLVQAQAANVRAQTGDLVSQAAAGRYGVISADRDLKELSVQQLRATLPTALERARAEIQSMVSSARAAQALAVLNEAASARAENLEAFERRMGEFGPAVRFFFETLRAIRGK